MLKLIYMLKTWRLAIEKKGAHIVNCSVYNSSTRGVE